MKSQILDGTVEDRLYDVLELHLRRVIVLHVFFFIRTKFIRTQAFGHPEIKNMIRTQGFTQQ